MRGMWNPSDADAYLLLEPCDDPDSEILLGSAQKVVVTPKGSPPLSVDGCQGHGGEGGAVHSGIGSHFPFLIHFTWEVES